MYSFAGCVMFVYEWEWVWLYVCQYDLIKGRVEDQPKSYGARFVSPIYIMPTSIKIGNQQRWYNAFIGNYTDGIRRRTFSIYFMETTKETVSLATPPTYSIFQQIKNNFTHILVHCARHRRIGHVFDVVVVIVVFLAGSVTALALRSW